MAEARLERLQKEVVPPRQTPPVSTVSDLEAEIQRLRAQLAQMEVAQTPNVGRHPPQSSTQAADMFSFRPNPQDLEFWMSDKYLELRGDQESILSLTDLLHQGAAQSQKFLPWSRIWCLREEHQAQMRAKPNA